MKKLILLILLFIVVCTHSQTQLNVYVINQQGCPYSLIDTWVSQCSSGHMTLDSVNYLGFQNLHYYQIPDTCYPIELSMCVYVGATQPPFPQQTPFCLTQIINGPEMVTLIADCSILKTEELFGRYKKVVHVQNLLGELVNKKNNQVLIYTYDDGTKEKVYNIE